MDQSYTLARDEILEVEKYNMTCFLEIPEWIKTEGDIAYFGRVLDILWK